MAASNLTVQPEHNEGENLTQEVHFQWQNPVLLKSIYPARERKLMEFLLVFDEIDLVKDYKIKKTAAIVQEYKSLPVTVSDVIEGEATDENGKKLELGQWYIDRFKAEMLKGINTDQELNNTETMRVKRAVMFFKMVEVFHQYRGLDQRDLLELVVERFRRDPNRYPEWLIYMVIHFSGMRYQSAHACYFDPKNLLKVMGFETNDLSDEQALEELVKFREEQEKAGSPIPDWAWHDIVRYTPLRLKYAQEDWEAFKRVLDTAEDHSWNQKLIDWKVDVTQWKKKHHDTLDLIVTRAVCNEVSEHIQHLRGLVTSPGISMTTDWYNKQKTPGAYFRHQDSEADFQPGAAIFWMGWEFSSPGDFERVRELSGVDLTRHIAPGPVKRGELKYREAWTTYFSNNMFIRTQKLKPTQEDKKLKNNIKKDISLENDKIRKNRNKLGKLKANQIAERKQLEREIEGHTRSIERLERQIDQIDQKYLATKQYLHWPHEAIVVKVDELITGRKTITFETADKTMGINERPNMRLGGRNQDVFIGYHPPKALSARKDKKLEEMIRWDKILQNPDYPARVRPSPDGGEVDLVPAGEAGDLASFMVTALNGVKIKDQRVLERGTVFQGVVREQSGIKTYQVSACTFEPKAVGMVLKEMEATPLERCFWIEVSQEANCKKIKGSNQKGFPMFATFKPKTVMAAGQQLVVSANHQINKSDLKGRIQGDGVKFWYLILHAPANPEAVGLYILAENIVPLSGQVTWAEIQAQIKAGKMPGEVEGDEEELAAIEEALMVTNPAGIELGEGVIIARGAKLLARVRKVAGLKSYQVTACDSEPMAVGQVIQSEDVSPLKSGFWVELIVGVNAKKISGLNQKGFPIFAGMQPKIALKAGQDIVVSATHQLNKTDLGGRVQGDGRVFWYLVLEHPGKAEAEGLYIPVEAVKLLSTPADWPEVQEQAASGQIPEAEEDDSVSEAIGLTEEPVMVISEEGVKLDSETVMPRGSICFASPREVNEEISYKITHCEEFPNAVGKMLTENEASLLDKGFWAKTMTITFCKTISGWNKKGFPIFKQKTEPVIRLPENQPFLVSASHAFNDSDVLGVIKGDGKVTCYLILEHPEVPGAAGLYVLAGAVLQQTNPENWGDLHKKVGVVVSTDRPKITPL